MRSSLILTAALLGGCAMSAPPGDLAPAAGTGSPGTLVVDLVDGTSLDEAREATGLALEWAHPLSEDESLAIVAVPDLAAAAAGLAGNPLVEVAEPTIAVQALGYPNDPMWDQQWNLRTVGVKSGWRAGAGAGAIVAVIDTGVSAVPDLADSDLLPGVSAVPGEPTADDGNGHGTHVAGTIAQSTDNGLGVAGVAPRATILPVKALSAQGSGQSQWIATAIDEAADQGADIINMSLGGGYSAVIANAVEKAQARGVLVIAAAGNTGREGVSYPAALPGVIGVSAVGPDDGLAYYSSWGEGVDISAPGGDTRIDGGGILQDTVTPGGGHAFKAFQGTSMATPHVAGAAAILWHPAGGDADVVAAALTDGAKDLGAPGFDTEYGHGRLDIGAALRALGFKHNGLLFGLGGLTALILAGLGGGTRRGRRALVMTAAGAISAGGLFFLPMLPIAPSRWTALLSRPLLQWPGALLPDVLASNPLVLSALVPVVLTFMLGPTRTLGPVVAGLCAGVGAHMTFAAIMGGLEVWPLPGWAGSAWLGLNGAAALLCAVAVVGVSRMRERQEGEE
jgi:serine protease